MRLMLVVTMGVMAGRFVRLTGFVDSFPYYWWKANSKALG